MRLKPLVQTDEGFFNETHISKAKRIEMCKSNYPRSEAEWDIQLIFFDIRQHFPYN